MIFSSMKQQVFDVVERTGLADEIGRDNFFASDEAALEAARGRASVRNLPAAAGA